MEKARASWVAVVRSTLGQSRGGRARRRCGPGRAPPRPGRAAPAPPGGPASGRAARRGGGCRPAASASAVARPRRSVRSSVVTRWSFPRILACGTALSGQRDAIGPRVAACPGEPRHASLASVARERPARRATIGTSARDRLGGHAPHPLPTPAGGSSACASRSRDETARPADRRPGRPGPGPGPRAGGAGRRDADQVDITAPASMRPCVAAVLAAADRAGWRRAAGARGHRDHPRGRGARRRRWATCSRPTRSRSTRPGRRCRTSGSRPRSDTVGRRLAVLRRLAHPDRQPARCGSSSRRSGRCCSHS